MNANGGPATGESLVTGLFPEAAGEQNMDFLALPSRRNCRIAIPATGTAARRSLRRGISPQRRSRRLARDIAALAVNLGFGRWWPHRISVCDSERSVVGELTRMLGRSVWVSVYLGPPRSNRKPVLQVMDKQGRMIAYSKVAVNELTATIMRNEARALNVLSQTSFTVLQAPALLAAGEWRGRFITAQAPLAAGQGQRTADAGLLHSAVREIAAAGGPIRVTSIKDSGYAEALHDRLQQLPPTLAEQAIARLDDLADDPHPIPFGSWHGDFSRWNMAASDSHLMVWDWERFGDCVPVGFDLLHHRFMQLLKASEEAVPQAGVALLESSDVRESLKALDPSSARINDVIMMYLLEIGARFSQDQQQRTGVRGGDVDAWLAPALDLGTTQEDIHG